MSKPVLAACTAVILCAVVGASLFRMLGRPSLSGTWVASACQEIQNATPYYTNLEYKFTPATWQKTVIYFTDSSCQQPFMTVITNGEYEFTDASHISYNFKSRSLTAQTSVTTQVFDQNKCGDGNWSINTAQDISKSGCMELKPISSEVQTDMEIKSENGKLYIDGNKNPYSRTDS